MKLNKESGKIAVVALIIAIIAMFFPAPHQRGVLGGITNYDGLALGADGLTVTGATTLSGAVTMSAALALTSTFQAGSTGTAFNQINSGQCYIKPYATTIAASSTAVVDCQGTAAQSASGISALTGVQNGDRIVATLSTTTSGTTFLGLHIIGAAASTTNGYIVLTLANLTGDTFTWPTTGAASGTAAYISNR